MEAVVEFHAFTDNFNRFIVKEFAIVSKSTQCQIIFDPPFDRSLLSNKVQKTVRWLESNFHKITWEEGGLQYDLKVIYHLCKPFAKLYTKGLEKAKFLRKLHPNVEEIDFNSISCNNNCTVCVLPQHCSGSGARCAFRSAHMYFHCLDKEVMQQKISALSL